MSGSADDEPMVSRREALAAITAAPASLIAERISVLRYAERFFATRSGSGAPRAPRFFAPHEWHTVRLLVDHIFPRDQRSGSATDAGVPEFLDFIVFERADLHTPMRGGLGWLDEYCRGRFAAAFADCRPADRLRALDAIAWPERATPDVSQGVAFFSQLRDLTASGFWSSPMGVADLQYLGNTVVHEWTGCPPAALDKLGVHYD